MRRSIYRGDTRETTFDQNWSRDWRPSETLIIAGFFVEPPLVPGVSSSSSPIYNKLSPGAQLSEGTSKSGTNAYEGPPSPSSFGPSASCILPVNKKSLDAKSRTKKRIIRYPVYVPLLTKSLIASIDTVLHMIFIRDAITWNRIDICSCRHGFSVVSRLILPSNNKETWEEGEASSVTLCMIFFSIYSTLI